MKKMISLLGVLALLAFAVTGCNNNGSPVANDRSENRGDVYPKTITPILIAEGDMFADDSGNKGGFVIKTQAELNHLMCYSSESWDDSKVAACSQYWAEKNIDFDMYQVIAAIDEVRPQLGWSINITSIKEYSDDIAVSIYIKIPKEPAAEVLAFIMPDSLELPPGLERGASIQQSDIKSQQLKATLVAINVNSIAKAFPDWVAADSITYSETGEQVKRPEFHRIFILSLDSEQDVDEAIRKLNDLPAVVYAEKNMGGTTLDNGPHPDSTQWRSYQIIKIPVTEKDVVFEYINSIPPPAWAYGGKL